MVLSCPNCQNLIDESRVETKTEKNKQRGSKILYKCPSCGKFVDSADCAAKV
jgi:uncharacterized C2H2 Zn-finger protein